MPCLICMALSGITTDIKPSIAVIFRNVLQFSVMWTKCGKFKDYLA